MLMPGVGYPKEIFKREVLFEIYDFEPLQLLYPHTPVGSFGTCHTADLCL